MTPTPEPIFDEMTLRQHLVAATMPMADATSMRQHICAAIYILNETEIAWAYLNNEIGDYCCDCNSTIDWDHPAYPNHSERETRGRFIPDPAPA